MPIGPTLLGFLMDLRELCYGSIPGTRWRRKANDSDHCSPDYSCYFRRDCGRVDGAFGILWLQPALRRLLACARCRWSAGRDWDDETWSVLVVTAALFAGFGAAATSRNQSV